MKSSKVQTLCVCGCCKRSLPASAFYINKKTGLPGNYCKAEPPEERETLPGMRQGKQLSGNNLYGKSHVATGTYSACP